MAALKHRKFPISHKLISYLRDLDVRGIRRLSVLLPRILLPNPKKVGPHILRTIHGFSMKIDPSRDSGVELSLFQTGTYEKGTLHLLEKFLKPGDCFVDIGANIGLMTIFASHCVGKTGKVLAFEAHPETYGLLKYNLEINKIENTETFAFALGDENGTAFIYDNWDINRGGASLVIKNEASEGHEIQVRKLDELISPETKPKVMKIDVEGFEMQVLKGAKETIAATKPILIVEFSALRDNHYDHFEMIDFIESFGFYELFKLSGTKERKSELVKINAREELPEHDNVVCIPMNTTFQPPILNTGHCSVAFTESETGIVYKKDLTAQYQNGEHSKDVFLEFESYADAEQFVKDFVSNNPQFECIIFDHAGNHLNTFNINGKLAKPE